MTQSKPLPQQRPLHGVRVLEFTHAVLGPACGLMLADFGAEVIRIERTPKGDPTRHLPGFGKGYYPMFNRNKKSMAVNLKTDEGQAIIHKLLATADVLIENFAPGTMARLGLGEAALKQQYPQLIYCTLKGFMPGPYEKRMALDEVVQMMSGLAYMTGRPGDPLRAGASVIDIMAGMYGAMGVLLALRQRDQTDVGGVVHSTLFETAAFLMGHHMAYAAQVAGPVPPMPARVSAWAVYHQFETKDGQRVFVGVTSDKQWHRFCEVFEQQAWAEDPRLQTNNGRIEEAAWLLPTLRDLMAQMTQADIIERCQQANLPFSPIARPEDLFTDPQLRAGDSLIDVTLPDGQTTQLPRIPIRFDEQVAGPHLQPPTLGADTHAILTELAYPTQAIEAYQQAGIVI